MGTADFITKNEEKFLSVEPGHHLRYTWEWSGEGEVTEIAVTFVATETGTQVQPIHSEFQK